MKITVAAQNYILNRWTEIKKQEEDSMLLEYKLKDGRVATEYYQEDGRIGLKIGVLTFEHSS